MVVGLQNAEPTSLRGMGLLCYLRRVFGQVRLRTGNRQDVPTAVCTGYDGANTAEGQGLIQLLDSYVFLAQRSVLAQLPLPVSGLQLLADFREWYGEDLEQYLTQRARALRKMQAQILTLSEYAFVHANQLAVSTRSSIGTLLWLRIRREEACSVALSRALEDKSPESAVGEQQENIWNADEEEAQTVNANDSLNGIDDHDPTDARRGDSVEKTTAGGRMVLGMQPAPLRGPIDDRGGESVEKTTAGCRMALGMHAASGGEARGSGGTASGGGTQKSSPVSTLEGQQMLF